MSAPKKVVGIAFDDRGILHAALETGEILIYNAGDWSDSGIRRDESESVYSERAFSEYTIPPVPGTPAGLAAEKRKQERKRQK